MIFFFFFVCVCNQALLNGYLLGFSDTMFEKLGKFFFFCLFVCSLLFSMFSVFPWFSLQLRAEVLFFHYPTVHVLTRKRRHPVKAPICSRRLSFLASMIVPLSALGRRRGKKKKTAIKAKEHLGAALDASQARGEAGKERERKKKSNRVRCGRVLVPFHIASCNERRKHLRGRAFPASFSS